MPKATLGEEYSKTHRLSTVAADVSTLACVISCMRTRVGARDLAAISPAVCSLSSTGASSINPTSIPSMCTIVSEA